MIRILVLVCLDLFWIGPALASPIDSAQKAYEDGNYTQTLTLLDTVDRTNGRSPRAESLRVLTLDALGRTREAYLSALAYERLTTGMKRDGNEAHQAMLDLRADLRQRLADELKSKQDAKVRERMQSAEQATADATDNLSRRIKAREQALAERMKADVGKLSRDEVKLLKDALKDSPALGAVNRIDERRFAIAELDTGPFRLGMTISEFESVVRARLRAVQASGKNVQKLIDNFRFHYTESYGVKSFHFRLFVADGDYSGSSIEDFAKTQEGYKQVYSENPSEFKNRVVTELERPMISNPPPGICGLARGASICGLKTIIFDKSGRAIEIVYRAMFPWDFRDYRGVLSGIQQTFGPANDTEMWKLAERDIRGGGLFVRQSNGGRLGYSPIGSVALWASIADTYSCQGGEARRRGDPRICLRTAKRLHPFILEVKLWGMPPPKQATVPSAGSATATATATATDTARATPLASLQTQSDASPTQTAAKAKRLEPGYTSRDCPECPEMVVVPSGKFMMGGVRAITISNPFAVGKFEVTFEQWDACVAAGGCSHKPDDEGWGRGNRPVINVSYKDAEQYTAWLSRKTGKTYRLLTEAEWEYAARAGTTTIFYWGNDDAEVCQYATVDKGGNGCGTDRTSPAGEKRPNAFGLHDMLGNVWEWTAGCVKDGIDHIPLDGSASTTGNCNGRITRGGSWYNGPSRARMDRRGFQHMATRYKLYGFRVARMN